MTIVKTTKPRRKSYAVSLAKFAAAVREDPFDAFCLKPTMRWDLIKPKVRHRCECSRDTSNRYKTYDAPRIRYFRDKFRGGKRVEPLTVSVEEDDKGLPRVHLYNGYHRFAGALLAKVKTIRIHIGYNNEELPDSTKAALRALAA